MSTGWNANAVSTAFFVIINLLGNEYWLEQARLLAAKMFDYKPTGK